MSKHNDEKNEKTRPGIIMKVIKNVYRALVYIRHLSLAILFSGGIFIILEQQIGVERSWKAVVLLFILSLLLSWEFRSTDLLGKMENYLNQGGQTPEEAARERENKG